MYIFTIFLTFCAPVPGGDQCLDRQIILEEHVMDSASRCATAADKVASFLLKNEVIYVNPVKLEIYEEEEK